MSSEAVKTIANKLLRSNVHETNPGRNYSLMAYAVSLKISTARIREPGKRSRRCQRCRTRAMLNPTAGLGLGLLKVPVWWSLLTRLCLVRNSSGISPAESYLKLYALYFPRLHEYSSNEKLPKLDQIGNVCAFPRQLQSTSREFLDSVRHELTRERLISRHTILWSMRVQKKR